MNPKVALFMKHNHYPQPRKKRSDDLFFLAKINAAPNPIIDSFKYKCCNYIVLIRPYLTRGASVNSNEQNMSRKFWWYLLQVLVVKYPSLQLRIFLANRRGISVQPLLEEADVIGSELAIKWQNISANRHNN